jgi:uncharacterized protein YabN with tetrapyrrole methylase and pyrophosphatase domain
VTQETPACIERAVRVLYVAPDSATKEWIKRLNPRAEALCYYKPGKPRKTTYEKWVDRMLECVRAGETVCAAFYGHPGIFIYASHEAIRRARLEGYQARMIPGISAEDCLFADLGIDPAVAGCQSYEATDFLVRPRNWDTSTGLILWQVGVVGLLGYEKTDEIRRGLEVLIETLEKEYGPDHEVILYEAAVLPIFEPIIERVPLSKMAEAEVGTATTVYIPPRQRAPLDLAMVDRLGIPRSQLDALEVGPPR